MIETTNGSWLTCRNEHAAMHSIYKLHAYLPMSHFDDHKPVYNLLKKAVADGIIPEFKVLNLGSGEDLKTICPETATIEDNENSRLFNSPFTIYLYDDFNPAHIADLCKKLEEALKTFPSCSRAHLSDADLDLTDHLTFRQQSIDGDYKAIAGQKKEIINSLQQRGKESDKYQRLKEELSENKNIENNNNNNSKPSNKITSEAENYIQGFYNNHYSYYKKELESQNLQRQFRAACGLLKIDPDELAKKKTESEWLEIINPKYRQATLKVHPDRVVDPSLKSTKERAELSFQLTTVASELLKEFAKNPELIDGKQIKILEQESYVPRYQYELKDGYVDNPYFYSRMAKSSAKYVLVQNWDYETKTNSPTDSKSQAVQIFVPQVKIYKAQERKTVVVEGYEAFYLLFMSGALSTRFSGWHFDMIFGFDHSKPFTFEQAKLIKKVLIEPEFFGYMGSHTLCMLAVMATKFGVLNIGKDGTEVFLYYYQNFPYALLNDVNKFVEFPTYQANNHAFDVEKVTQYILSHPENLYSLTSGPLEAILSLNLTLRRYILADKTLTKKLSINYCDTKILCPFLQKIGCKEDVYELKDIKYVALKQLFYGNHTFLAYFSTSVLIELKSLISQHLDLMPEWMISDIDNEIACREGKREIVEIVRKIGEEFWDGYTKPVRADAFIKREFFSGNISCVFLLNLDALLWLVNQSEIHWTDYLVIAKELIKNGANTFANHYLKLLLEQLGVEVNTEQNHQELLQLAVQHQSQILEENKKFREEQILSLEQQYEAILYPKQENQSQTKQQESLLRALEEKAEVFGAGKRLRQLYGKKQNIVTQQFFRLADRIQTERMTVEIKEEFAQLKQECIKYGIKYHANNFDEFLPNGANERSGRNTVGSSLFQVMGSIFGFKIPSYYDKSELKPNELFGIDIKNNDLLQTFSELFCVYECFGAEQDFYRHLTFYIKKTDQFDDIKHFDSDLIKQYLIKWLDDELAVYGDGARKNVTYKKNYIFDRQIDQDNIQDFPFLNSLYCRLRKEAHLREMLPQVYQKIYEAELKYQQELLRSPDRKPQDTDRPLQKYIEIRKYQAIEHKEMEILKIRSSEGSVGVAKHHLRGFFSSKTNNNNETSGDKKLLPPNQNKKLLTEGVSPSVKTTVSIPSQTGDTQAQSNNNNVNVLKTPSVPPMTFFGPESVEQQDDSIKETKGERDADETIQDTNTPTKPSQTLVQESQFKTNLDKLEKLLMGDKFTIHSKLIKLFKDPQTSLSEMFSTFTYAQTHAQHKVNYHKNETWDNRLGIKNTTSWQETWKQLRYIALRKLFKNAHTIFVYKENSDNVDLAATRGKRIKMLEDAKQQILFNTHISNHWYQGAFGDTRSVEKINFKIAQVNRDYSILSKPMPTSQKNSIENSKIEKNFQSQKENEQTSTSVSFSFTPVIENVD